jgi:hypothetical protein
MQESVPRIEYLDDELVEPGYFERKIEEVRKMNLKKQAQSTKLR